MVAERHRGSEEDRARQGRKGRSRVHDRPIQTFTSQNGQEGQSTDHPQEKAKSRAANDGWLFAYAAGMAVPFLAVALGLSRFRSLARTLASHHRAFQIATGALIVGVGVLVATNAFSRLAGLVPWAF